MLTCPFGLNCELGPNSWMAVQIVTQHAGNLNSRGKQRSVKDNTSLSTRMGPGGNLWLRPGCLGISSAWEPTGRLRRDPGAGARARARPSPGYKTGPGVALTP